MLARAARADSSAYETNTLYVGNLHADVTLTSLQTLCACFGPVDYVKVVRDKTSHASAGYAFVKFTERTAAETAVHVLSGTELLGKALRVNWAFQAPADEATAHQFSVFVGDLARDVTDAALFDCFRHFGCSQARVLWDHATGLSKRYGFVTFCSKEDGDVAIAAMDGQYIGWSRVRCRWAQHKQDKSEPPPSVMSVNRADAFNTNVYVGNICQQWTEADLCSHFSAFGPLAGVQLHKRGGYAFVQFEAHNDAVSAIVCSHGTSVGGQVLKCSWGRSMPNVPSAAVPDLAAGPSTYDTPPPPPRPAFRGGADGGPTGGALGAFGASGSGHPPYSGWDLAGPWRRTPGLPLPELPWQVPQQQQQQLLLQHQSLQQQSLQQLQQQSLQQQQQQQQQLLQQLLMWGGVSGGAEAPLAPGQSSGASGASFHRN